MVLFLAEAFGVKRHLPYPINITKPITYPNPIIGLHVMGTAYSERRSTLNA